MTEAGAVVALLTTELATAIAAVAVMILGTDDKASSVAAEVADGKVILVFKAFPLGNGKRVSVESLES